MGDAVGDPGLRQRALVHAALGEPARLAVAEALIVSDRSPKELAERLRLGSNLLAHHLDVLEAAGVVARSVSAGDARRRYVRLNPHIASQLAVARRPTHGVMTFLCTHNSARSQLAATIWTSRTGLPARSAGTRPAARVHRGAGAAARRAGLSLDGAAPSAIGAIEGTGQVVTVCDLVHEELDVRSDWWHWSIPDPTASGRAADFDAVVDELRTRIEMVVRVTQQREDGAR